MPSHIIKFCKTYAVPNLKHAHTVGNDSRLQVFDDGPDGPIQDPDNNGDILIATGKRLTAADKRAIGANTVKPFLTAEQADYLKEKKILKRAAADELTHKRKVWREWTDEDNVDTTGKAFSSVADNETLPDGIWHPGLYSATVVQ